MTRTLLLSLLAALVALAFGAAPTFASTPAGGGPTAHAAHDDPGDEAGNDAADEPDPGDGDACTGAFVATADAEGCADDESQDGDEQRCAADPGRGDEGDDESSDDEGEDPADDTGDEESADDPGDEPAGEDPGDEEGEDPSGGEGDEPTAVAAHAEHGCEAEASAPPRIERLRVVVRGRHGRALRIRFHLDRAGRVRLALAPAAPEARASRRCAPLSRTSRGRHGCRRSATARPIVVRGHAGANTTTLRRWRHRLKSGVYRLTATPAGPGAESVTTTFKLSAPTRRG